MHQQANKTVCVCACVHRRENTDVAERYLVGLGQGGRVGYQLPFQWSVGLKSWELKSASAGKSKEPMSADVLSEMNA